MVIFDFPDSDLRPRRLLFDRPVEVLIARDVRDVRRVLRAVDDAARRGLYAAGFVAYEAAPAFDPAHVVRASVAPAASSSAASGGGSGGALRAGAVADGATQACSLPLAWFGIYANPQLAPAESVRADAGASEWSWLPGVDRAAYDAAIARVRDAIADGDVYQVNYTFPLSASASASASAQADSRVTAMDAAAGVDADAEHRALYERLARGGHGRYGAYLDIGSHRILSFSPELFFSRVGDRLVCRPMKGTIARGRWPEEDAARAERLRASAKDRAENVMIVDLVRNDLGRVAQLGSVRVSALCELERYPTVWQMTSTIEADARPGTTLDDVFAALFPCGSVTGAPKISAMQQIAALESAPRGVYCGAIGLVGPDGETFNVAIRTMTIDIAAATAVYPVGGGVTWDSAPHAEYAEALAKAALLRPAPRFSLLETMRLDVGPTSLDAPRPGARDTRDTRDTRYTRDQLEVSSSASRSSLRCEIPRLDRHLARLAASARDRDIPLDLNSIRDRLHALAATQPEGSWRLRLLVSQDGRAGIEVHPSHPPLTAPPRVALALTPVDDEDWFLCNKTTHRAVYESHRSAAIAAAAHGATRTQDIFDVLLWNRRGELTEFTIGNIVLSLDGRRWTPPRTCGLLAGTFRAELLDRGEIAERILTREDLQRADAIWLINSVREWVPVAFIN